MSDSQANCPRCHARPETARIGALVSLKCTGCGAAYLILPRVPDAPPDWDERFIGRPCGNCHLVSRVAVEEDGPVYEGLHFGLNQPVHVKVLAPDLASDPKMVERFVRQAQLASKVIHPHVPRVLDIGPSRDIPYIIRERTQGRRLSARSNGPALSIAEVTAVLPRITEALSAVHDAGIVHLNVKPHSIILTEDKDIRLVGFTAAIRQTERPQIIAGSPGYTASEQIMGKDLGPSADIFALGLLFYEMLTGRPAFNSEEEAALFAVPAEMNVPSDSNIPQHLAELIQRMTRGSTDDRIQSCALVLEDLGIEPQSGTATSRKPAGKISTVGRAVPGGPGKISTIERAVPRESGKISSIGRAVPGAQSVPEPPATPAPEPQEDLEALFEPGAGTAVQPMPAAPTAPDLTLQVNAESPPMAPPIPAFEPHPPTPSVEAPPAGPAAPSSTASGKIHMQCPHCGVVVRGFPEVFARPIRCPECNVESSFKPEPQETAHKPVEAPAAGPEEAGPADTAAPKSTASGKIHMQCPHCGVVVRGLPEVFAQPIRCPECNVESSFKPEPQEAVPKPAGGPEGAAPPDTAAPSTTASGKIHMQCPHCGLVVRGFPEVFAQPIRCPDCKVESSFKPESQETAAKASEKSGSGWKKWGSSLLKRRGQ